MAVPRSIHGMTRRAVIAACALFALAVPEALAATARNGAPLDPQNLIADDLEAEALASYARNAARAPFKGHEIVIVDYRLPSSARRLYVLNLNTGAVEPHYVAHGRGSDPGHTKVAMRFGDTEGSGMSSIGAYRGLERYQSPTHGPALRLAGLDRSNASAYERLIVVHTAPYFDPAKGKFGRSLGCFVVTVDDRRRVYDVIADGGFLFAGPSCLASGGGNACRKPDILMAAAQREETPLPAVAAAPKAPEVARPAVVLASAAPLPVVRADAGAPPRAKPRLAPIAVAAVFVPPVPRAKPAIDSEVQIAAATEILARRRPVRLAPAEPAPVAVADATLPLPQAKPALIALAAPAAADVPVPSLKPSLGLEAPAELAALATVQDVPKPRAKPDLLAAPVVLAALEPEAAIVPVPMPKPSGLRRMADAGTGTAR